MDKTEKRLIQAARDIIKKREHDTATTLGIAKAAGVSEMTLFRKFKSKEHLLDLAKESIAKETPSSYDYFYYDSQILRKTLSLREELIEGKNVKLLSGYVYFVEFCIAKFIERVEQAPYSAQIFEMVNWGRFDIGDKEIQYLKKTSRPFKFVYELNDYRSILSGWRHALSMVPTEIDTKTVENTLDKLEKLSLEIDSEIEKLYRAKRKFEISDAAEKSMIFHWFMVSYVYEPPRLFFSTISNATARSFIPEVQYLAGFKFSIEKIMNWLTDNKYVTDISNGLLDLDALEHIHGFYSKMHGTVFKGADFTSIFNIVEPKWESKTIFKGRKVDDLYQLNLIFRGREIKVINVEEIGGIRGNRDAIQRLLIDSIFGDIALGVPKIEIIQFEEFVKDGKDWDNYFSYALYLPMHGLIGDASTWLIFPRLDGTSNWEPYDEVNRNLRNTAEKWGKRISIRKYKIKPNLLQKYIDNEDLAAIWKKHTESRLNTSKGLLAEFLAYFYVWDRYHANLVEFHKEEDGTEVDVVAEDANSRYIIEVKNSLTSNRKRLPDELDSIVGKLDKLEKKYSISTKTTKKLLFVIEWNWDEDKFLEVEDWDRYTLNNYFLAKQILRKHNTDIVIYSGMKELLKLRYKGFEEQLKIALGLSTFD